MKAVIGERRIWPYTDAMARIPSRSVVNIRQLLLALFAIMLILRVGGGCEAMAATPQPSVGHAACADMPINHHKPVKAVAVDCALCVALPGRIALPSDTPLLSLMAPAAGPVSHLTGLFRGPAPPPPRIV